MVLCQKGECAKTRFFRRAVQSFLNVLQCVIITSLWSYLKWQNATRHEIRAVFDGTIHFPKFSFILILWLILPFEIRVYTLLSPTWALTQKQYRLLLYREAIKQYITYGILHCSSMRGPVQMNLFCS